MMGTRRRSRPFSRLRARGGSDTETGIGSVWQRILRHLERGRSCIQIDLDVRMKRDFSVLSRLPYDFVVSRAFAFPPFAVKPLGFVAGTGFYIAKPTARPLCVKLPGDLRERLHRDSHLDQHALNLLLCATADGGHQRTEVIQLDGLAFDIDVFEVGACRIGVLPRATTERHPATEAGIFGNHHRALLDLFLAEVSPKVDKIRLSGGGRSQ